MSQDAQRTLFHPFETGVLAPVEAPARSLLIGAMPGLRLPDRFSHDIALVQRFRPDALALERAGWPVSAELSGTGYDCALVLAGRHRGRNELDIAEAIARTREGGLIVVAGSKDDGIASLRKRLETMAGVEGSLPKYHGLAFWFRNPADGDAAVKLRGANPPTLVEGRYHTGPGMFSFDRVDAGTRLLAGHIPADLRGRVADFCAGWGYLAARLADACPRVAALDLYEADFEALAAARRNLAAAAPATRFFWRDLLAEPVEGRYDAIVMNPPFHKARAAEPEIGAGLIRAASKALMPGGRLFMVANRQLPYERVLAEAFASHAEVAGDGAFKVFAARR